MLDEVRACKRGGRRWRTGAVDKGVKFLAVSSERVTGMVLAALRPVVALKHVRQKLRQETLCARNDARLA